MMRVQASRLAVRHGASPSPISALARSGYHDRFWGTRHEQANGRDGRLARLLFALRRRKRPTRQAAKP
jgi:hypothetical protein